MNTLKLLYEDILKVFGTGIARERRDGLLSGAWGALLFVFYYEHYIDPSQNNAPGLLEQLYEELDVSGDADYTLCNGLTGVFWMLHHLNEQGILGLDIEDIAHDFIGAAIRESERYLRDGNFDFLHGSSGICFLLTQFSYRKEVREHLEHFVSLVQRKSAVTPQGLSFPIFDYGEINAGSDGIDSLSMAHGTCAMQVVLSKIHAAGVALETCRELVYGSIEKVLKHKNGNSGDSALPRQSMYPNTLDGKHPWSRISWCYGDLSVALALWHCGQYWNEAAWKDEAIAILRYNGSRKGKADSGITDVGFCHGSAGAAAIYRKFWLETGILAFREVSEYWYRITEEDIFFSEKASERGLKIAVGSGWQYRWDMLNGSAGVGLSLLCSLQEEPLPWYRCLLIDTMIRTEKRYAEQPSHGVAER